MDNFNLKTYLVENKLTTNSRLNEFTLPKMSSNVQSIIDRGVEDLIDKIPDNQRKIMQDKAIKKYGEDGKGLQSIVNKANMGNIVDKLPDETELNEIFNLGKIKTFFTNVWEKFTDEFGELDAIIGSFASTFITVAVVAYQNALKVKPVEMGITAFTVFFFAAFLVTFIYTLIKDKF